MQSGLSILGIGTCLPPTRATREVAAELGADTSLYRGWDNIGWAKDDDHPSGMAASALRAALSQADVDPSALKLVVFAGVSRDFPPAWSVATEVIGLCGLSGSTVGIDLTVGCLGTLAALNAVCGWLALEASGLGAIVTAERWAYTVDRSRVDLMGLWGHGDGAGALVVGVGDTGRRLTTFRGAEFSSDSAMNGRVLVKYGGTRFPAAPEGEVPYLRGVGPGDRRGVGRGYLDAYSRVFDAVRKRFDTAPTRLICNQVGTGIVAKLPDLAGVSPDEAVVTGHEYGHLGAGDIILGLQRLADAGRLDEPILLGGSAAYAFGAGLLTPDV